MTQTSLDLDFGDGTYTFKLPLPQINELQRKTGIGIGGLFNRVLKGCVRVGDEVHLNPGSAEFYALDVIETIRQGLIGGGKGVVNGEEIEVTPVIATKLVDAYVMGRPLVENWNHTTSILTACVMGYDPPKKAPPAGERATAKTKGKKASSTTPAL